MTEQVEEGVFFRAVISVSGSTTAVIPTSTGPAVAGRSAPTLGFEARGRHVGGDDLELLAGMLRNWPTASSTPILRSSGLRARASYFIVARAFRAM